MDRLGRKRLHVRRAVLRAERPVPRPLVELEGKRIGVRRARRHDGPVLVDGRPRLPHVHSGRGGGRTGKNGIRSVLRRGVDVGTAGRNNGRDGGILHVAKNVFRRRPIDVAVAVIFVRDALDAIAGRLALRHPDAARREQRPSGLRLDFNFGVSLCREVAPVHALHVRADGANLDEGVFGAIRAGGERDADGEQHRCEDGEEGCGCGFHYRRGGVGWQARNGMRRATGRY